MHRRFLIIIAIVAVIAVAGAAVGIIEARAQGEPALATITPAQLIANVGERAGELASITGDVNWSNDILGLSMLSFGGRTPGDITSLLSSGSGRVWAQDGRVRFEIQGGLGDTTIIGDSAKVWVYSSTKNTATEYAFPAKQAGTSESTMLTPGTAIADPVATIESYLRELAPAATLTVGAPIKVAGRSCYVLSLTPTAPNTIFGSARVAIDGETFIPLRVELLAKGATEPVLTAGFTSISYATIEDSIFTFTPPQNATLEHKTLTFPALGSHDSSSAGSSDTDGKVTREPAALTLAEAAAEAGFTPLTAHTSDPALAFAGAYVIPAQEVDLESLLGELQAAGLGGPGPGGTTSSATGTGVTSPASSPLSLPFDPVALGPTIVQRFGRDFGKVVLAESKIPAEFADRIQQVLEAIPLLGRTEAGGVTIYQLNSALGSIAVWIEHGLLVVAGGLVSETDLAGFIANVS